jgi:Protein of unknown function (DUF3224)
MKIATTFTRASASLRCRLAAACLTPLLLATLSTQAQTRSQTTFQTNPRSSAPTKKAIPSLHATGPFEVKIDPQPPEEKGGGAAIGRMFLDKQFHGDLEATSKGTMLAAGTGAKNSSGGYVALEIVTGSLKGRTGTFVLQHSATMNRGVPQLSIIVVPDSATGQLTGLAGKMNINIVDGKHTYDFEYTLPEAP